MKNISGHQIGQNWSYISDPMQKRIKFKPVKPCSLSKVIALSSWIIQSPSNLHPSGGSNESLVISYCKVIHDPLARLKLRLTF